MSVVGHNALPASPAEIRRVLVAVETVSRIMRAEDNVPPLDAGVGELLHGLVQGIEGTVYPVPGDAAGDLGYRVGQSIVRGGSPWV